MSSGLLRLPRASGNCAVLFIMIAAWLFISACEAPPRDGETAGNAKTFASPIPAAASPSSAAAANVSPTPAENFSVASISASPLPSPSAPSAAQTPPMPTIAPVTSAAPASNGGLLIPVANVSFENLSDTFKDARSEGRVHDAIDIIAPRNTPVLACADGRIVKLFQSERGGITLYQLSEDEKTVYYYAHLDHYADGVEAGKNVRRGDVIAYVGDTGNATPGNYHLHFAVALIPSPREIHKGTALNPYELFKAAQESKTKN